MKRLSDFVMTGAMVLSLVACTTLVGVAPALSSAQRDQAQRDMPRPAVEADASYESVTVEADIPVPHEAFAHWFRTSGAPHLGTYLIGTPTVPGVARTEPLVGTWHGPGDRQRIVFIDGHSEVEEIIQSPQPQQFRYVAWNLTNRTGRYTTYAVGEFAFSGDQQNTRVQWTYSFRPKVWPDGLLIRTFVQTDYRDFMASALAAMRKQAISDLEVN
ncbi:MAG: hypothetical protein Q7S99_05785 [Parvibaculum sp.]|nr:hypothetical protein [Parvibaculum sp.]